MLLLVQFSFTPVNIFEKMFNVQTAPKEMYSKKQSWSMSSKGHWMLHEVICSNIQIDSTKIYYQGKLFVHLTD